MYRKKLEEFSHRAFETSHQDTSCIWAAFRSSVFLITKSKNHLHFSVSEQRTHKRSTCSVPPIGEKSSISPPCSQHNFCRWILLNVWINLRLRADTPGRPPKVEKFHTKIKAPWISLWSRSVAERYRAHTPGSIHKPAKQRNRFCLSPRKHPYEQSDSNANLDR